MLLTGPFLTGCSALRLGYANGSTLAWIWIDGYFDFSRAQSPDVQKKLDNWFAWHRGSQLPAYAALLAAAQADISEPTTAAAACRWAERIREQLDPALQRATADFAELVPGMGEPQLRHLERRYAKIIDEMRGDYLQPDAADRLQESVKRTEKRAEQLYGALDEAQLKVLRAGVAASPFNPELWLVERQRRQRDVLQTLRKLQADKADLAQRTAALRVLLDRTERSPNAEYRAYQVKLTDYNCAFAAQIHNATTAAQRQKARDKLKGWEEDARSLSANPANSAPA